MRKFLGLLLALAVVATACGGDDIPNPTNDPQGALESALDRLAAYEGVELTVGFATDAPSLIALSEGDLTDAQAQQIIDSSITISSRKGETPTDSTFEIQANIGGIENAFEMKVVDDAIYLRADVNGLLAMFGGDSTKIAEFEQQAAAQGMDFVGAAIDGEWIAFTGVTDAMKALTGQSGMATPNAEDLAAVDKFAQAFKELVAVAVGDKAGPGTNLVATVNLKEAATALLDLMGNMSSMAGGTELPMVADVPDEDINFDIWIEDGNLTQVEFDFLQLAKLDPTQPVPTGVDKLAFRFGIAEFGGTIEVPEDATEVDFQQLIQGMFGDMMGGGLTPGTTPADMCDAIAAQLEGQTQEIIDQVVGQFAAECPDLAEQFDR